MDHLGLVQPVDGHGQRIGAAVAHAVNGGLDAGLGQPFGEAHRHALHPAVAVVDERTIAVPTPGMQRML